MGAPHKYLGGGNCGSCKTQAHEVTCPVQQLLGKQQAVHMSWWGVATAARVPVADAGLCRETWALGRRLELFDPCPEGASFPFSLSRLKEMLLCSLVVNCFSFRRKAHLPCSKNLRTPNKHWPLPTRTEKNCSRRLGNTTHSLSFDSGSAVQAPQRSYHQQQCRLGQAPAREPAGSQRGREHMFTLCVLPAGCQPGRRRSRQSMAAPRNGVALSLALHCVLPLM